MEMEELKTICENDLFFLAKDILGYAGLEEQPHLEICEFLDGPELRKMMLLPRGTFKTTISTISRAIQKIIQNPNIRILIFSETYNQSKKFLSEIKQQLQGNEKLIGLYGNFIKDPGWKEEEITVAQRTKKMKEPTIMTAGADVVRVGFHFDLIIIDDPHSQVNTATKDQIEKVKTAYKLLIPMLEPEGEICFVGTRWHFYDLASMLLEDKKFKKMIRAAEETKQDGTKVYLFPQRLPKEKLQELKEDLGSYLFSCNPAEAPIIMSDWTTKPISKVKVGDDVVGWVDGGKNKNAKLVKTRVLETNSRIAQVQKVFFESGRTIRCTPDHNWWIARLEKGRKEYMPAKVGRTLKFVVDPSIPKLNKKEKKTAYWLGGIFDGEGSCPARVITLTQSKTKNPEVFKKIEESLKELKFDYGVAFRMSGSGDGAHSFWLRGGTSERRRFVLLTDPVKKDGILKSLYRSKFAQNDKILRIELDKVEPVYALTTETGNYVAWGYCSKNCQYQNNPVDDERASFKRTWFKYYQEEELKRLLLHNYITIDPGGKEEENDFTGVIINSVDINKNWYIRKTLKLHISAPELIDKLFYWNEIWHPIKIGIEKEKYSLVVKPFLEEKTKERDEFLPIVLLTPKVANKEMRIKGLSPRYEAGRIHHLKEDEQHTDLEEELLRFPKSANDDMSDALSMQLDIAKEPVVHRAPNYKQGGGVKKFYPSLGV